MTTRADALAGVRYFSDVRAIAAQVGVAVPDESAVAARFAATDSIDLDALAGDAALLDDVITTLHGATDTAHDARRGLPRVWSGAAAETADTAVATHLRAAQDVIDGIGTVSATVAAAAIALGRVQEEKHRTLAMLRTDRVAGQPMSTISVDDIDADPESCRAEITAAVELFTRTMDVVDDAVAVILTALTDSFVALPAPREVGPAVSPESAYRSVPRRDSHTSRRTDVVVTPTAGADHRRGGSDSDVVVAAISAGASIAGAALAAASSVGTAAAAGVGAVLTHLMDAAGDTRIDDNGDHTVVPPGPPSASPVPAAPDPAAPDPAAPVHSAPVPAAPTTSMQGPTTQPSIGVEPSAPSVRRYEPEIVPEVPAEPAPSSSTAADDVAARNVPSVGPRRRDREPPRGRPDPDDGGGLALAGDR
ncbi:hypothetical protein [Williamsia sp.]|uniref:hypothetical protein n=1 Tax=Williamsia sp. TaxID=1872085 RepID=UPI001A2E1300|nr:hypothetical protein [Williamsia sp.]MBJ7290655.1 hypothetical protein [Williamsia sp.]